MKKFISILLAIGLAFGIAACSRDDTAVVDIKPESQLDLSGFKTVQIESINTPLQNPGMGFIFYENAMPGYVNQMPGLDESLCAPAPTAQDWQNSLFDGFSAVGILSSWDLIEKEPGVFDFSLLDTAINYWAGKGKEIILRFCTDTLWFGDHTEGAPAWLFEAPYNVPYIERQMFDYPVPFKFADYTNETYLERLDMFLTAFVEHYKDNKAIVSVDMRGYGIWGEGHSGHGYDTVEERRAALSGITETWVKAFSKMKDKFGNVMPMSLQSSPETTYCTPYFDPEMSTEDFMYFSAHDVAYKYDNVSVRRDGVGGMIGKQDSGVLTQMWLSNKRLPLVLENGAEEFVLEKPMRTLEEAMMYHANYVTVPGHDRNNAGRFLNRQDLFDQANRELGYRFVANSVTYPSSVGGDSSFSILHSWTNEAFGRAYNDFPLKFYLLNGSDQVVFESEPCKEFKTTSILKGSAYNYNSTVTLKGVPAGEYTLALALTDSNGEPYINLAMPQNVGKIYKIGSITVNNEGEQIVRPNKITFDDAKNLPVENENIYATGGNAFVGTNSGQGALLKSKKIDSGVYRLTFDYKTISSSLNQYYQPSGFYVCVNQGKNQTYKQDIRGYDGYEGRQGFVFIADKDFTLEWGSNAGGKLALDNIYLEKLDAVTLDFEGEDNRYRILSDADLTDREERVIDGGSSMYLSTIKDFQSNPANNSFVTNQSKIALKGGKSYTVSFLAETQGTPVFGSYFFVKLYNTKTKEMEYTFKWHDSLSYGLQNKSFNILCADEGAEYELVFGVYGQAKTSIDNLVIAENKSGINLYASEEQRFIRTKPSDATYE